MKNKLMEYLVVQCVESGELATDANILRQLRVLGDWELEEVFKKLYEDIVFKGGR